MIYLIFILFVLYTIACCMDGPDLKPIWKKWLGKKLYHKAKYFWPEFTYMFAPIDPPRIEYYHTDYKPISIKCQSRISEMELFKQKMYGFNLTDENPKNYYINRVKERCIESLIHNVKNSGLIDIQVSEDPYNASINVMTELKVLKNIFE